jgi:hypothetical protein
MDVIYSSDEDSDVFFLEDMEWNPHELVTTTDDNLIVLTTRTMTMNNIEVVHVAEHPSDKYGSDSCANIFDAIITARFRTVFSGDTRVLSFSRRLDCERHSRAWRVIDTSLLLGNGLGGLLYPIKSFEILFAFDVHCRIFWMTHGDARFLEQKSVAVS